MSHYEPLLFQIFFPWKFLNIYSFSCLVSLLQLTAKRIAISKNIFICLKYYKIRYYALRFFIFKFDLNVKMVYSKNSLMLKLMIYVLCTHDVTCNLSRWNNGGNYIYKKVNKNWNILKKIVSCNKFCMIFNFMSICVFISTYWSEYSLKKCKYIFLKNLQLKVRSVILKLINFVEQRHD